MLIRYCGPGDASEFALRWTRFETLRSISRPMTDISSYDAVDLGCGENKHEGALGVDIVDTGDADVTIDLETYPWALPEDSFGFVYCRDILEHVDQPLRFLKEVYRTSRDGATVYIRTPHFTNNNVWVDPTQERGFSAFTFQDYNTADGEYAYYIDATFVPESIYIKFISARQIPWNLVGRYIANRWTWWYEKTFLRALFPAQGMRITLRVEK